MQDEALEWESSQTQETMSAESGCNARKTATRFIAMLSSIAVSRHFLVATVY
jgi:hypothetical protein